MRLSKYRCTMAFLMFVGILFVFFSENVYAQDAVPKKILILDPYNNDRSTTRKLQTKDWAGEIISGINDEFIKSKMNIEISIEYMDSNNEVNEKYIDSLYNLYKCKFNNKKFDVVITIDDNAFNFAKKYAAKLFQDTPILFGGVCDLNRDILKNYPNFVGVTKCEDIKKTIELALKMNPNTKQIFVITDDTINGFASKKKVEKLQKLYFDKVKFIFCKNQDRKEVQKSINELPKDSIILLEGWLKDKGEYMTIKSAGNELIEKINIPVYSTWDNYMNNGVIGGVITESYDYGRSMGKRALRILKGEKAPASNLEEDTAHKYVVDYNQAYRMNIRLDSIPKNVCMINNPEKSYKIYKKIVWIIVLIIILVIFIMCKCINKKSHKYKSIKELLFDSENLFSTIINATPDIICCIDPKCRIVEANNALLKLLDIEEKSYKYKNIYDLKSKVNISKEKYLNFKNWNEKIWRLRTIYRSEEKIWFKTQKINKIYDLLRIPLFNEDGTRKMLVLLGRDITSHKVNEKNKKVIKELKYYNKIRTDFFSNISHELRTPLNVIFSAIQVMQLNSEKLSKNLQNKKNDKYTKIMKQNCYRLLRIINNLIDITKIDAGNFSINLRNYDIVNIVEDIVLSIADYVESKGLSIVFDTEFEEKIMAFDADAMERIILNLLSNAIKFTPKGGNIKVNIYDGVDNIIICIKDTGVGIPKEKQTAIFERFIQVDKSLSRRREGSGIGLSLIKELIEMHGGTISLNSEEGKGTEFRVKLPVKVLPNKEENVDDKNYLKDTKIQRIKIEFSDIYN